MPGRLRIALQAAAVLVVALLLALLGWKVFNPDEVPDAGRPAPNFTLPHLNSDEEVSLASFRGKAVVLNFWASSCIPCKQEMPRLQQAATRWAGKSVAVVGIDVLDSRGAARAFAHKHGVTYAIGYDPLGDTVGPYGIAYTPTTFFVDRRGRIVKRILGPVSSAELDSQIGRALSS